MTLYSNSFVPLLPFYPIIHELPIPTWNHIPCITGDIINIYLTVIDNVDTLLVRKEEIAQNLTEHNLVKQAREKCQKKEHLKLTKKIPVKLLYYMYS